MFFSVTALLIIGTQSAFGLSERAAEVAEAVDTYANALQQTERDQRLESFRQAERMFAELIERHGFNNADLHTNRGNAALQAERPGLAILAYRRALKLAPGHEGARKNLEFARKQLPDWVPRPREDTLWDTFFFWQQSMSTRDRRLVEAGVFMAAGCLLALSIAARKPWARNLALIPALAWVGLVGVELWTDFGGAQREAVVIAAEVEARAADSFGAAVRFAQPLPGGAEVDVLEQREEWVHVRLADGRDGWVPTSALAMIDGGDG